MGVDINRLMGFKKEAGELRDKVIQANATMTEIDSNIANLKNELKELGVKDPDKAEEEIEKLETKAQKLYDDAYKKIEKWL